MEEMHRASYGGGGRIGAELSCFLLLLHLSSTRMGSPTWELIGIDTRIIEELLRVWGALCQELETKTDFLYVYGVQDK